MTGMYNVLAKLREFENRRVRSADHEHDADSDSVRTADPTKMGTTEIALTKKEKTIHEQGLVSVLKQIHDDLDKAVFDAYGWSHDLSDEEILEKLVELNHQRAEEEANGKIRWLRPEFQDPNYEKKQQSKFPLPAGGEGQGEGAAAKKTKATKSKPATKKKKQPWPKTLPERITAVRSALADHGQPAEVSEIAKLFSRAKKDVVEELLETLVTVGQARATDDGR